MFKCLVMIWENLVFNLSKRFFWSWTADSLTKAGWISAFITAWRAFPAAIASSNPSLVVRSAFKSASWCFLGNSNLYCYHNHMIRWEFRVAHKTHTANSIQNRQKYMMIFPTACSVLSKKVYDYIYLLWFAPQHNHVNTYYES